MPTESTTKESSTGRANSRPSGRRRSRSANQDATDPAATKKKVIAALLLVGLLIAVLTQPDSADDSEPAVTSLEPATRIDQGNATAVPTVTAAKASTTTNVASQEVSEPLWTRRELSELDVERVIKSPVFQVTLTPLRRSESGRAQVNAVYGSGSTRSALIGDEIVRSGRPLRDGREVLDVTPDGVRLSK